MLSFRELCVTKWILSTQRLVPEPRSSGQLEDSHCFQKQGLLGAQNHRGDGLGSVPGLMADIPKTEG